MDGWVDVNGYGYGWMHQATNEKTDNVKKKKTDLRSFRFQI